MSTSRTHFIGISIRSKWNAGSLILSLVLSILIGMPAYASVQAGRLQRQTAVPPRIVEPPDEPLPSRVLMASENESGPLVGTNLQSLAPWIKLPRRHLKPVDANGLPAMSLQEQLDLRVGPMNASMGTCACSIAQNSRQALTAPIGQVSIKDANGERFAVSVVSFDYALRLFQDLDRRFVQPETSIRDGCHVRAQEMSRYLEKRGVATGKAMATGMFQILSDRLPNGRVTWTFHVAPMVIVDEAGHRRVYVLDPALFAEPVPLESWLSLLVQNPRAQLADAYLTNRFTFQPSESHRHIMSWRPVEVLLRKL